MMEHFLTTEVFRKGIRKYLEAREYKTAVEDDLWTSMEQALEQLPKTSADLPDSLPKVMKTWSLQPGYPVVTVERNADKTVKLSQERYFRIPPDSPVDALWLIPLSYSVAKEDFEDTISKQWLTDKTGTLDGVTLEDGQWIVLNNQQIGYYRVNYDESLWKAIISKLNTDQFEDIHLLNRAQILDDAFALARSNHIQYNTLLDLMKYVSRETDYVPLYSFFQGVSVVDRLMKTSTNYEQFQTFIKNLLSKVYTTLSTDEKDNDSHTDKLNRINVLKWMCDYGHKDCSDKLLKKLEEETPGKPVSPDLQAPVYCNAMRVNGTNYYTRMKELYLNPTTEGPQKARILNGISCFDDSIALAGLVSTLPNLPRY